METRQDGQTMRQANMEEFIFGEEIDESKFDKPAKVESEEIPAEEEKKDIEE